MFSRRSKKYIIPYTILLLVIIFILLPIEYPNHIKTKGKLIPAKEWYIVNNQGNGIFSSVSNNLSGKTENLKVNIFERGDALELQFNHNYKIGELINKGDTLAQIISSEMQRQIESTRNMIKTELASLSSVSSEEKPELVELAKSQLAFAKQDLVEKEKYFARQEQLLKSNVNSVQDYELAEGAVELAKLNVTIAEKRLEVVTSGEKEADVDLVKARLEGLQKELNILEKKYMKFSIVAPFSGQIQRSYGMDTILTVYDRSVYIWYALVPIDYYYKLELEQNVEINILGNTTVSKIKEIDNKATSLFGKQYITISGTIEDNSFPVNTNFDINIIGEKLTLFGIIYDFFNSWIS